MLRQVHPGRRRRAAIIVLSAFMMVFLIGMVAFGVDLGYIQLVKAELQRTADAAAHAAAMNIGMGESQARLAAQQVALQNRVAGLDYELDGTAVDFGRRDWDGNDFTYNWTAAEINAVRVVASRDEAAPQGPVALFFAPVLGFQETMITAESIVAINPRDIVMVIDLSGSMHHDSEPWTWAAQNDLGQDPDTGEGGGDAVRSDLWDDMGLTDAGIDFTDLTPGTSDDKRNNNFDFQDRVNNRQVDLPVMDINDDGVVDSSDAQASVDFYVSEIKKRYSNAGKSHNNFQNSVGLDADGNIQARLNFDDVRYLTSDSDIMGMWKDHSTPQAADLAQDYAAGNTGASTDNRSSTVSAYDFITDQYLSTTMRHAKPSLTNAATRDTYRTFWRGYLSYTRGYSSGSGSSNGIDGFSNPSTNSSNNSHKDRYGWDGNFKTELANLKNVANYKSYIQFMMDHGFNMKVGLEDDGSAAPLSEMFYTPMSSRWADDTGDDSNAYRRFDSDLNTYRPIREQPTAGVSDAILAALKEIKEQNASLHSTIRDKVAIVTFHSSFTPITGNETNRFLDPVDDYDQLVSDVVNKASQSLPNAYSNVDGTGGSTNTMSGLRNAGNFIDSMGGRSFSTKWVVLFTDGVPNEITSPDSISNDEYHNTFVDMDGDGTKETQYYYSQNGNDARNASLKEVADLAKAHDAYVHTITAGAGHDKDITKRMSALTDGEYIDSGNYFHDYTELLIEAFESLANRRSIHFGIDD
ncbi:von Willebrand factor type A domain protein [Planctomycetes bacterium Pan216]|uniref:von Willebrand factor type A domain protein n=1 Tax=Kolteria novifilia TaxID=2527975 RepID=A0A518B9U9_9BACT|nr:von Willebrand factor type A domain protein [Planctomycetes bacterium Pan216]